MSSDETVWVKEQEELTHAQVEALGMENAGLEEEIEQLEEEKKVLNAEFGDRIKARRGTVRSNAEVMRTGYVENEVECTVEVDVAKEVRRFWTMAEPARLVKEEPLEAGEHQATLA